MLDQVTSALNNFFKILSVLLISASLQLSTGVANIKRQIDEIINPPCSKPVTYKIGIVDTRFNITTAQLKKRIEEATLVWEEPVSRNLFEYDSQGTLTIDLVFDQRQSITNEIGKLEDTLNSQKENIQPQVEEYKRQSQEFNNQVAELNREINFWNSQGGAPKDVYETIKKQEEDLKREADRLNSLAKTLNQLSDNYNVTVSNLNETIGDYNAEISTKPEEGIFDPATKTIEIYFITDQDELIHTLAHEFGHALTIDHIDNPKAIMYPKSTKVITPTHEDIAAIKTVCNIPI